MAVDTKPLERVIKAWREDNAERVAAMAEGNDEKVQRLNESELYRLRDIAGEAMHLVDELRVNSGSPT